MTANAAMATVDAEDVRRFTDIASDWWNPVGPFKPLHDLNPARLSFIKEHLCTVFGRNSSDLAPFSGLRLIDIGCGGGILTEPLARLGAQMTAIDAGAENIAAAKAHAEAQGLDIDYRHQPPEALAGMTERFDGVISMEVVEHVADLDLFFAAVCGLSMPGGAVFLSTINRTLKSLALAKMAAEYVLRWVPAGTHDWRRFVRPSELARGLRRYDVALSALDGLIYSPMGGDWSRGPNLDMNYMAFGRKKA